MIAGLDNVLVLERGGEPLALLGAGAGGPAAAAGASGSAACSPGPELRGRGVMKNLLAACLRAYAQSGYDFAVTAPGTRPALPGGD